MSIQTPANKQKHPEEHPRDDESPTNKPRPPQRFCAGEERAQPSGKRRAWTPQFQSSSSPNPKLTLNFGDLLKLIDGNSPTLKSATMNSPNSKVGVSDCWLTAIIRCMFCGACV